MPEIEEDGTGGATEALVHGGGRLTVGRRQFGGGLLACCLACGGGGRLYWRGRGKMADAMI